MAELAARRLWRAARVVVRVRWWCGSGCLAQLRRTRSLHSRGRGQQRSRRSGIIWQREGSGCGSGERGGWWRRVWCWLGVPYRFQGLYLRIA